MNRSIAQNDSEMEIARMRMDQARDKLCEAIISGNCVEENRLEKIHAAAIADFKELKSERAVMFAV